MANETTRKTQEAQAEEQRQDLLDRIEELEQQLAGARAQAERDGKIIGEAEVAVCGCIWCGETVGMRTDLTIAAKVRAHLGACQKNPLVHEIKRLEATLQAQGWHHDRLADSDRIFGELEARRARAANEVLDLRARQRELLTSLATTASLSAVLQTRLEESEKLRGATSAKLDALEHKLWALVGGPVEPRDDLVEAIAEELDCSSCVDQKRDLAQDANAVLDAIRNLVQSTWAFKPAEGSIEELLAALERNVAEDQASLKKLRDAPTLTPKFQLGQRVEFQDARPGIGVVTEILRRTPGQESEGFTYRTTGWPDGCVNWVAEEDLQGADIPF